MKENIFSTEMPEKVFVIDRAIIGYILSKEIFVLDSDKKE